jgi:guanylate kinase
MLIVITGPSGVGKTTIINSLIEANPNLKYSVSMTTRKPRQGEKNGVDYYFISDEEFKDKIRKGELAEWSEVYENFYGRSKHELEDLSKNHDVLVGIDVQGAIKLREIYPHGVFIFILPKSIEALEKQLRGRGTDDESSIKTRLDKALQEIEKADNFDYKVVNDIVERAVKEIQLIIKEKGVYINER